MLKLTRVCANLCLFLLIFSCQFPVMTTAQSADVVAEPVNRMQEQEPATEMDLNEDIELPAQDVEQESSPARILVILPEQIDIEWFWYHYSVSNEMQVQTAVEKQLLRDGYDLVDVRTADSFDETLDIESVTERSTGFRLARELNADYLILGQTFSVPAGESNIYGVKVHRANADVTARVFRIPDEQLVDVVSVNVTEGDQSARTAARNALKEAGKQAGRSLRNVLRNDLERPVGI